MIEPKCFCRPQVKACPKCSKPDWTKIRGSNGQAPRDKIVAARLTLHGGAHA
jgi:hypothetical protein